MKKVTIVILIAFLALTGLAGCTRKGTNSINPGNTSTQNQTGANQPNNPADTGTSTQNPNQDKTAANGQKTDSGRYVGQVDNNFIEIKISGVPDQLASRVFMLSENIKTDFDRLGLQEGTNIRFNYTTNSNNQNIINRIEKI